MVHEDLKMSKILTKKAFENAIMTNGAIGGSTNAVVHLLAVAGRMGVDLTLDDWDRLGRTMPCLVNLMPSGQYLMEDFYYAGGLPVVLREIGEFIHKDALTVNGKAIWDNVKDAVNYNEKVITPIRRPFKPQGGIVVVKGNLAPDGAVLKPSAATPKLLKHKGRAVVFEDIDDLHARIDDPEARRQSRRYPRAQELRAEGLPGLSGGRQLRAAHQDPEARHQGHDPHFGCAHVRHRVRHRSCCTRRPRRPQGGPLALVKNGDIIELDVGKRLLRLHVSSSSSPTGRTHGSPGSPTPSAAGSSSTARQSSRRTRASTSTSSSANRVPRSARSATRPWFRLQAGTRGARNAQSRVRPAIADRRSLSDAPDRRATLPMTLS
jgi:dihydroxy-acid dehydratase